MSTVERQKIQLGNNSRTTCIAEPKQSLHEENTAVAYNHDLKQSTHGKTTSVVGLIKSLQHDYLCRWQKWGDGRKLPPTAKPITAPASYGNYCGCERKTCRRHEHFVDSDPTIRRPCL